ncbi:MAG: hypothetical protein K0Q59_5242, partial [Paenibacillus sp.]|nr:hypothetical protein [Paenibacillus sp.]
GKGTEGLHLQPGTHLTLLLIPLLCSRMLRNPAIASIVISPCFGNVALKETPYTFHIYSDCRKLSMCPAGFRRFQQLVDNPAAAERIPAHPEPVRDMPHLAALHGCNRTPCRSGPQPLVY